MKTLVACAALLVAAGPALADQAQDQKEQDCRYQSQVVAAVQKARLGGVRERKLVDAIARTNPTWPERYNKAIPVFGGSIYARKKRDIRKVDLGAQWFEMCVQNYELIEQSQ